jgi:hypothetical protein
LWHGSLADLGPKKLEIPATAGESARRAGFTTKLWLSKNLAFADRIRCGRPPHIRAHKALQCNTLQAESRALAPQPICSDASIIVAAIVNLELITTGSRQLANA